MILSVVATSRQQKEKWFNKINMKQEQNLRQNGIIEDKGHWIIIKEIHLSPVVLL